MASLTTLYGQRIKSIQRGSVSYARGGSGTITITSVNTVKSILYTNCSPGYAGTNTPGLLGISHNEQTTTILAGATLTNSTTISWLAGSSVTNAVSGNGTLRWELVEFY